MEQIKIYTTLLIRQIIAMTTANGEPMTQKTMAQILKLSEAQMSRLYQGKSTISGKTLGKLQRLGLIALGDKHMVTFNNVHLPQLE